MALPVCPRCRTPMRPTDRVCPYCRLPIAVAPSPALAPSPDEAPSPAKVCGSCRAELPEPRQVSVVPVAGSPVVWEAYVCSQCGRVEWYEPPG